MGFFQCSGMICPAHCAQRADKTTWLSSVAFYQCELQNPFSTFSDLLGVGSDLSEMSVPEYNLDSFFF